MLTVDCLGQDFGAGGLAGAPGTSEQIGVGQPIGAQLIFQRGGHLILAENIGKGPGPPFAVKHLIQGCPTFHEKSQLSRAFIKQDTQTGRRIPSGIRTDR